MLESMDPTRNEPYTKRAFWELVMPGIVRIWNELFYLDSGENRGQKRRGDEILINDSRVFQMFSRLTGSNPTADQYGDFSAQTRCIRASQQVARALFVADETYQQDGDVAIAFADGWMQAWSYMLPESPGDTLWVVFDSSVPPDTALSRAVHVRGHQGLIANAFVDGWRAAIAEHIQTPGPSSGA